MKRPRFRTKKGFGIHSPFVYQFITQVVEERNPYYAYEILENARRHGLDDPHSARYGALLFRTALRMKCRNIAVVGSRKGLMGLYLAMAAPTQSHCWLLEETPGLLAHAEQFAQSHRLPHLHCLTGDYPTGLHQLSDIDLLFINQLAENVPSEELLATCLPRLAPTGVVIVDNISKNPTMNRLWQALQTHSKAGVRLDLKDLGMIFFNAKLPNKLYKVHFNNGKKQNLHPNGRRGLHLFGRRNASAQNPRTTGSLRHGR